MKKEIEVKAKVENFNSIITKLESMDITLSGPITQNDETFVDNNYGDYDKFQSGQNVLRIRESNGKFIFTLKQPQSNDLDCIEKETEISNPEEFKDALLLMGYKTGVEIHKVRRKAKYKDYEICLDDVKEIGKFIEIEKITDEEDAGAVQNELLDFLGSLGVNRSAKVLNGYDTLVYRKKFK
jgi:adenylate cyclase class 2